MRGAGTPSFSLMEGESVLRRVSATRYLIFVFVFAVATNLIHPVTPMLLQRIGCPDYMFGVAFAMMSFGGELVSFTAIYVSTPWVSWDMRWDSTFFPRPQVRRWWWWAVR